MTNLLSFVSSISSIASPVNWAAPKADWVFGDGGRDLVFGYTACESSVKGRIDMGDGLHWRIMSENVVCSFCAFCPLHVSLLALNPEKSEECLVGISFGKSLKI